MARRKTTNDDLPPGLHRKRGRYYYGRRMEALGPDLTIALREWARRRGEEVAEALTFADAARHYRIHALHLVARSTQREYTRQLVRLEAAFGKMALATIRPSHVYRYMSESAPISGTREKALLSLIFNHARKHGLTEVQNPCQGIRGTKSRSTVYIPDEDLAKVIAHSDPELALFLEVLWRTGQDCSVVLGLTRAMFQGDYLQVTRTKTGESVRICLAGLGTSVSPSLRALLHRPSRTPAESGTTTSSSGDLGPGLRCDPGLHPNASTGTERGHAAGPKAISDDLAARDASAVSCATGSATDLIFTSNLKALQQRLRRVRERTGVHLTFKQLRAKAATDSPDLASARSLLGHASEATTAIYRRRVGGHQANPVTRTLSLVGASATQPRLPVGVADKTDSLQTQS